MFISDIPASTPAVVAQNDVGEDDDDEPPLNENDDDDLDDVDEGEEQNTQHLVLAQFDKVFHSLHVCAHSLPFIIRTIFNLKCPLFHHKIHDMFGWVGDTYQEQMEMLAEGWHYAHKQ